MSKVIVPKGYCSTLGMYDTQTAIGLLKRTFEERLCLALNLKRVSAPLFVDPTTGLNDDLSGVERPVRFDLKETGKDAVVVHSLAKWKRMALAVYGFSEGEGLYTDMNAIRRDEEMDNLHSVYTDQWDWEKIINRETIRLQLALQQAKMLQQKTELPIIVFLHFPPVWCDQICNEILNVLHEFEIKKCYFGHIHGATDAPKNFTHDGIDFSLISSDHVNFTPIPIVF